MKIKKESISAALNTLWWLSTTYVIVDWVYMKGRQQGFSEGFETGKNVGELAGIGECLMKANEVFNNSKEPEPKEEESE